MFEHVEPIREAVDEIERVVRPDGVRYHVFPTRECWGEGHRAAVQPPAPSRGAADQVRQHAAPHGARPFRDRPREEWVTHSLAWIDEWTVYRAGQCALVR